MPPSIIIIYNAHSFFYTNSARTYLAAAAATAIVALLSVERFIYVLLNYLKFRSYGAASSRCRRLLIPDGLRCIFVCLSVCLLATSHKTTDRIFMKILPEMYLWTKKSPLNYDIHQDVDPGPGIFNGISRRHCVGMFYAAFRLESRKPLWRDLQIDVTSRWREDWQSATVVNSTLVADPTIRLPGFDLHRRQWSLLNRFRTGKGHCNACHKKWGFTDNELQGGPAKVKPLIFCW